MATVNASPQPSPAPRAAPSQAAWREEMLGEFLKKMRDHQPPEEPAAPAPPVKGFGKGQYLDVYV